MTSQRANYVERASSGFFADVIYYIGLAIKCNFGIIIAINDKYES